MVRINYDSPAHRAGKIRINDGIGQVDMNRMDAGFYQKIEQAKITLTVSGSGQNKFLEHLKRHDRKIIASAFGFNRKHTKPR